MMRVITFVATEENIELAKSLQIRLLSEQYPAKLIEVSDAPLYSSNELINSRSHGYKYRCANLKAWKALDNALTKLLEVQARKPSDDFLVLLRYPNVPQFCYFETFVCEQGIQNRDQWNLMKHLWLYCKEFFVKLSGLVSQEGEWQWSTVSHSATNWMVENRKLVGYDVVIPNEKIETLISILENRNTEKSIEGHSRNCPDLWQAFVYMIDEEIITDKDFIKRLRRYIEKAGVSC